MLDSQPALLIAYNRLRAVEPGRSSGTATTTEYPCPQALSPKLRDLDLLHMHARTHASALLRTSHMATIAGGGAHTHHSAPPSVSQRTKTHLANIRKIALETAAAKVPPVDVVVNRCPERCKGRTVGGIGGVEEERGGVAITFSMSEHPVERRNVSVI